MSERCIHNFRPEACPNGTHHGIEGCPGPEWNNIPEACPGCGAEPVHYGPTVGGNVETWTWHCGRTGWFNDQRYPVVGEPSAICDELAEFWGVPT